ncbi:MAG TPA: helix-turn-helix transcriptional regulator [Usitatibacter sp.]|nr:helix-turn-helix transcriptional regulator [Usitatibacter sp.]
MDTFDLLLRAATFALAMAGAAAILLRPARRPANAYAAFAVGGIGAFMVASAPGAHATLGLGAFFFNAWCISTPAAVWMLALVLFREDARPGAAHLVVAGVLVCVTMAGDYGRYALGPLEGEPQAARALFVAGRLIAIALLLAACWQAISHWRADLVEQRRLVRAAFVTVIGAVFVALASSEFVFGGMGAPLPVLVVGHSLLLALAFVLLQFVARGGVEGLLATAAPRPAPVPLAVVRGDGVEAALARRVVAAMVERRLWKRERLGIGDLAAELHTQEYLLRRAINRHLGYRNFNDFLHDYRLAEAARRLSDPAEARLPILTIALDCGYGSIGPFNRAFKARFEVTPTQYRQVSALQGAAPRADSGIGAVSR